MILEKSKAVEMELKQVENLFAKDEKRARTEARILNDLAFILNNADIDTLEGYVQSSISEGLNVGDIGEAIIKSIVEETRNPRKSKEPGIDGYTKNGTPYEVKTLLNNTAHSIKKPILTYYLVCKRSDKQVYRLSGNDIEKYNLIGKRINLDDIQKYGTLHKTYTKKIFKGLI